MTLLKRFHPVGLTFLGFHGMSSIEVYQSFAERWQENICSTKAWEDPWTRTHITLFGDTLLICNSNLQIKLFDFIGT